MLLKRLDLPPHTASLLPLLASHGVRTTEQIIITNRGVLLNLLQQGDSSSDGPAPSARAALGKHSLATALDELIGAAVARQPVARGDLYFKQQQTAAAQRGKDPDGIFGAPGLDKLLGTPRCIIEVCGAKGSGRSLLALHAVLRVLAADPTATARWIDTEGALNATRVQAMLPLFGLDESALDRLMVSTLFRLDPELFDVLDEVRSEPNLRVLVIDNVTALFRDALMGATAQGHAAMVLAMNEVAELSNSRDLLTIVTNTPASAVPTNPLSSFSATAVKPALGLSFAHEVDVELLLQDTGRVFGFGDLGERERVGMAPGLRILVEVLKSKVSPSGTWTVLDTDGTTLLDVVPPPVDDEATQARSAGAPTGRAALGPLSNVLE